MSLYIILYLQQGKGDCVVKNKKDETQASNNHEPGKTRRFTKAQIAFYTRKKKYCALKAKRASGELLSYEEELEEDKLKTDLFASVLKFGMTEAKKTFMHYQVDSDAYLEIQQDFAEKFYEKLDSYDPLKSTPTTFYVRYFREAISNYLAKNTLRLSQYDARNSRKIAEAIQRFDKQGIQWTEHMIADHTGLTLKVVKSTLQYRHNANYANIDDEEFTQLASSMKSPEEYVISQEQRRILCQEISGTLTPDERNVLIRKINPDGRKEKSFEAVRGETGLAMRETKTIYNRAVSKLRGSHELCKFFNIESESRQEKQAR